VPWKEEPQGGNGKKKKKKWHLLTPERYCKWKLSRMEGRLGRPGTIKKRKKRLTYRNPEEPKSPKQCKITAKLKRNKE